MYYILLVFYLYFYCKSVRMSHCNKRLLACLLAYLYGTRHNQHCLRDFIFSEFCSVGKHFFGCRRSLVACDICELGARFDHWTASASAPQSFAEQTLAYLASRIQLIADTDRPQLRSASDIGCVSFHAHTTVSATEVSLLCCPPVWNALPSYLWQNMSYRHFKQSLKGHTFML